MGKKPTYTMLIKPVRPAESFCNLLCVLSDWDCNRLITVNANTGRITIYPLTLRWPTPMPVQPETNTGGRRILKKFAVPMGSMHNHSSASSIVRPAPPAPNKGSVRIGRDVHFPSCMQSVAKAGPYVHKNWLRGSGSQGSIDLLVTDKLPRFHKIKPKGRRPAFRWVSPYS